MPTTNTRLTFYNSNWPLGQLLFCSYGNYVTVIGLLHRVTDKTVSYICYY